ncbi:MAG: helix-turn-helix transcriptional regulator [Alsobacter sp.]
MSPSRTEDFRTRLEGLIARSGLTASTFARGAGIDRSTLSQLLDERSERLPRAETLMAIARHSRVSIDWLLGLSGSEQVGADIIEAVLQVRSDSRTEMEPFVDWMKEARGVRVKTVPVTYPDFLKTNDVLRFEYAASLAVDADRSIEIARTRLAVCREPDTELEAAFPVQNLELLATGAGVWKGLPPRVRREALESLRDVYDQLYPGLRLYLYDELRSTSVPFSVFGTQRAAVYIGHRYLVFNAIEHIRLFSQRFDEIIRTAVVLPHALGDHIETLLELVDRAPPSWRQPAGRT